MDGEPRTHVAVSSVGWTHGELTILDRTKSVTKGLFVLIVLVCISRIVIRLCKCESVYTLLIRF